MSKAKKQKPRGTKAGREIIAALTELRDALREGGPLEPRFTVRTVEMPDEPSQYDARSVRATRARLGASQPLFAKLLGASTKLVQAWELGSRKPSPMARRLLDEFNASPDRWLRMLKTAAKGDANRETPAKTA